MSLLKTLRFTMVILFVLSVAVLPFSKETQAETGKTVELNTRGACLKVDDFKALMNSEVKKMQSGDTIKLIIAACRRITLLTISSGVPDLEA